MDQQQIRTWETALDAAELSPITANLPRDCEPGDVFEEDAPDGTHRKWVAVRIVTGNTGGRWAYWLSWIDKSEPRHCAGVGPNPEHKVIADKVFNGDAAHFVGMLGLPYVKSPGVESTAWVLVSPKVEGPKTVKVFAEPVRERYERSREVHDVDTGETKILP